MNASNTAYGAGGRPWRVSGKAQSVGYISTNGRRGTKPRTTAHAGRAIGTAGITGQGSRNGRRNFAESADNNMDFPPSGFMSSQGMNNTAADVDDIKERANNYYNRRLDPVV